MKRRQETHIFSINEFSLPGENAPIICPFYVPALQIEEEHHKPPLYIIGLSSLPNLKKWKITPKEQKRLHQQYKWAIQHEKAHQNNCVNLEKIKNGFERLTTRGQKYSRFITLFALIPRLINGKSRTLYNSDIQDYASFWYQLQSVGNFKPGTSRQKLNAQNCAYRFKYTFDQSQKLLLRSNRGPVGLQMYADRKTIVKLQYYQNNEIKAFYYRPPAKLLSEEQQRQELREQFTWEYNQEQKKLSDKFRPRIDAIKKEIKYFLSIGKKWALKRANYLQKVCLKNIKTEKRNLRKQKKLELQIKYGEQQKALATGRIPPARNGEIKQSGLTRHARKCIRVTADCYNLMIAGLLKETEQEKEKREKQYDYLNRFITLTFRRIIPTDQEAKKLLNTFLQRFRDQTKKAYGTNTKIHYIWVAERQKGKIINGKKSYRLSQGQEVLHFHILTPEKLHHGKKTGNLHIDKMNEAVQLNTMWNEIVLKWAHKTGKINNFTVKAWQKELQINCQYNLQLAAYRNGASTNEPKKPSKSKFLLTPNLSYVYHAGAYMSKYMSKENAKICGNMWNMSQHSRQFTKPVEIVNETDYFKAVDTLNYLIKTLEETPSKEKPAFNFEVYPKAKNSVFVEDGTPAGELIAKGIWTRRGDEVLKSYFDYQAHQYKAVKMEQKHKQKGAQKTLFVPHINE